MTAGERLKDMVTRQARISVERFAEEIGRSRPMVYNYFKWEVFPPKLYKKFAEVLRRYGIDASPLNNSGELAFDDPKEIRALLRDLPEACLSNVRRMLLADRATKTALLAIIEDRLERHQQQERNLSARLAAAPALPDHWTAPPVSLVEAKGEKH